MGQRDGFASSDLTKLNKMYNCGNIPSSSGNAGSPNRPVIPVPVRPPPPRPSAGGNSQFTHPVAQIVSGIGNFFSALGGGGRHDETDNHLNANEVDED